MVKFGERMATEAVPEWSGEYINYPRLTSIIYKFSERTPQPTAAERQDFERDLLAAIDDEISRADTHFMNILAGLEARCIGLRAAPVLSSTNSGTESEAPESVMAKSTSSAPGGTTSTRTSRRGPRVSFAGMTVSVEQDPHADDAGAVSGMPSFAASAPLAPTENSATKATFQDWFHEAESLERFAELATEAVRKAAKKAEKVVPGARVKHLTIALVESKDFFNHVSDLQNLIQLVKLEYAHRFHQALEQFHAAEIQRPRWAPNYRMIVVAMALFFTILCVPMASLSSEAHGCLALFALVITLWITEAFPYFATALLIPLVAVPLGVIRDPVTHHAATTEVASRMLLMKMFENVQILVLGGLTMAKALDKSQLAATAEAWLHKYTARHPSYYMLGSMVAGCVLCAFVSNVAAPVLVLGVVRRTLFRMPRGEDRAAPQRAMLLGLAFACNLGGMLSPIASPQNAVALHVLANEGINISFSKWVISTLPFVAVMLLAAWLLLIHLLRPFDHMDYVPLPDAPAGAGPLTGMQRALVMGVCGLTAFMWCFDPTGVFGGPAMIALIPIVCFFGFGILEKDDFNTLSWHLMFLLTGGSMLGLCASSSGLLDSASKAVLVLLNGESPYYVLALVVIGVGVITTFVSHTVAAMVLLPLIATLHTTAATAAKASAHGAAAAATTSAPLIGGPGMGTVLVVVSVLMCSGAMAFPISSFPNVNSLLAEDEQGQPWLAANDYLLPGSILSVACGVLLIAGEAGWAAWVLSSG